MAGKIPKEHVMVGGIPIEVVPVEWTERDFEHTIGLRNIGPVEIRGAWMPNVSAEELTLMEHASSGEPLPMTVSFGDGSPGYSREYIVTEEGGGEYTLNPVRPLTRTEAE